MKLFLSSLAQKLIDKLGPLATFFSGWLLAKKGAENANLKDANKDLAAMASAKDAAPAAAANDIDNGVKRLRSIQQKAK